MTRSYKLGDLVNILPDGVVIHPKYKGNLGARVFFVRPNTFQMMVEKVRFETRNPEEEVAGMSLQDRMAVHKEGEDIEDDTVQEKRGGKTMFDKIVDKKTVIKEKDIDDIEAGEEEKTFAKIQREKLLAYKKEISQKAGKKTPFKSAKKSIMEDYSLKENFKDMKETKDKKGGGGAAEPTQK